MNPSYDVIVIGGGHNGLTTAAVLAKSGKSVLVLEKRNTLGGMASTEELIEGYKLNPGFDDAGLFQDKIFQNLELEKFGVRFIKPSVSLTSLNHDGENLVIWRNNLEKTQESIRKFSEHDAEIFPEFIKALSLYTATIKKMMLKSPPNMFNLKVADLTSWIPLLLSVRGLGKKHMMNFIRILPMTAKEFLDEWFENEFIKAAFGSYCVTGNFIGPQSAGSVFLMLYHQLGEFNMGYQSSQFVLGGIGNLSKAISEIAIHYGAKIKLNHEVSKIIIEDGKAKGVLLSNNESIYAKQIVSNLDPRTTLFDLCGPHMLEPKIMRKVRNIKYHGSSAKINLILNELPEFSNNISHEEMSGHVIVCPTLEYLEKAFDDSKYGNISQNPYLDITFPTIIDSSLSKDEKHIMSISFKFAPYKLLEGTWEEKRAMLYEITINTLSKYIENISEIIASYSIITPSDYELEYGLYEGNLYHGQMGLDQILFSRPISGYAQCATPIDNLFLCGSGSHPGGGVTGAPGYNAAKIMQKQIRKR